MQPKGIRLRAFALQGRAPQIVLGINPKTMPGYKSVADLKGKKIGVTAPGSSTNVLANFVLAKAGLKPSDVVHHRRGRGQRRGRRDARGPDRRDQQPRPGDHAAAAQRRPEDRLRHPHRRRGRQGLRRPDARGLPVCAAGLHRQEPGHRAGASPTRSCAPTSGSRPPARPTSSRPCPRATCSATARSTSTRSSPSKGALSVDGMIPPEGAATALRALQSVDESLKGGKIDLAARLDQRLRQARERQPEDQGMSVAGAERSTASAAPSSRATATPSGYTAVRDVSLAVGAGEFVSVVGPTGCGKSTLLNMAAGPARAERGRRARVRRAARGHQPARRLHVPGREPDAVAHGAAAT